MLSLKDLNPAQQDAITHIYEVGQTFLIGQMGSGKTIVALAALAELLGDDEISRVLVVSTGKIVRDVWPKEPTKWKDLAYMADQIAVLTGTDSEMKRRTILDGPAKIVCINFEMLPWLFDTYGDKHVFDALVIDEVTKMKAGGVQFKKLRPRLKDFKIRLAMTGTPVEENWLGLFYPMMVVDGGKTFGKNRKAWLNKYFYPEDFNAFNWVLRPGAAEEMLTACKPYMMWLPDYTHELPEITEDLVVVDMTPEDYGRYLHFTRHCVDQSGALAVNAAVLSNKLQQFASGFLYHGEEGEERQVESIHDLKVPALLGACTKAKGVRRIWAYQFEEEQARLRRHVPNIVFLDGKDDAATLDAWRKGYTANLALHPKSAGHGLDLTAATELMLCSPIWSRDQMRQLVARMRRRGQTEKTQVFIAVAKGTIDEEIVARERGKAVHMELLKKHWQNVKGA